MSQATELVDRQITAYNRRDLDAFVACYSADAPISQPDGSLLADGQTEIRSRFGELFGQSPKLHAEIRVRIEVGPFVIDGEFITGFCLAGMPTEVHSAVAYRFADGLIQSVQLFG
ncbi:MAG: nuclear transport factor 2 family protein [Candidatus Dormiibacterota bacterium]